MDHSLTPIIMTNAGLSQTWCLLKLSLFQSPQSVSTVESPGG